MKFKQQTILLPPDDLKQIIRFFWILETEGHLSAPAAFRVVADGCPTIIFQYGEDRFTNGKQHSDDLPSLGLFGQTPGYRNLYARKGVASIGLCFHPHALKSVFGFHADEITNDVTDLDLIQPGLSEQLMNAESNRLRIEYLSGFIRNQLEHYRLEDSTILESIRSIGKSNGNLSLPGLHKSFQLSERQFERKFKQHTGIPPILFSRIARFQSALHQIRTQNYQKLSDVAFDNHYADQPHFIREFKEFSGYTPGRYLSSSTEVIDICRLLTG